MVSFRAALDTYNVHIIGPLIRPVCKGASYDHVFFLVLHDYAEFVHAVASRERHHR